MDWSKQRHYEDVEVGDLTEPVTFHLTVQRLVYEAGGNRDFAPIHHNDEIARAGRAPAMYANNGFIQGMWERAYREFFGADGWIQKVGPFRMRIFNVVGEPSVVRGKVAKKWQDGGKNYVELEMWTETPKGHQRRPRARGGHAPVQGVGGRAWRGLVNKLTDSGGADFDSRLLRVYVGDAELP